MREGPQADRASMSPLFEFWQCPTRAESDLPSVLCVPPGRIRRAHVLSSVDTLRRLRVPTEVP